MVRDEIPSPSDDDASVRKQFAERVNTLLNIRDYPQKNFGRNTRLADELGLEPQSIHRMLAGHIPGPLTLRKLAQTLRTTIDFLLGLTEEHDIPSLSETEPLIGWFWHPEREPFQPFSVPTPDLLADNAAVELKEFWAVKQDDNLEKVTFNAKDTTIADQGHFLVSIDSRLQIRQVELMANGVARLWFDGHTLPAELDPATMLMVKGNTPCLVLGRVVARVDVSERDFS